MAMTKSLRAFQVAVGNRGQTLRIEMQFEDETREQIYLGPESHRVLCNPLSKAQQRLKGCERLSQEVLSQPVRHGVQKTFALAL